MQRSNTVLAADGTPLFVRSWGQGRPIVFLAGWTLSSAMWCYQMAPLARAGFQCVAFDRRGHGQSGDPGCGYDFDTLADDLARVIDTRELRDVVLVGHSVAAGEMVRYVSRHGAGSLAGLVFVSPAATPYVQRSDDNPGGVNPAYFTQLRATFSSSFPDWARANAEPYFTPGTSRDIQDWTLNMMLQTSLQAAYELNHIGVSTDFRAELAQLVLPSLVIHGDRDASAPLECTGRPTAAAIRGARLHVYEGGPHGLYFTHQQRLTHDIAEFARER